MPNTLEVDNLNTYFRSDYGSTQALENISFHIKQGEVLALVGESGSGKTVTSLSIMGLLPTNGFVKEGKIVQEQRDLLKKEAAKDKNVGCLTSLVTIGIAIFIIYIMIILLM